MPPTNTGDTAPSPTNDLLPNRIDELIVLLRTKYNEQYIGHKNSPQKCVITRPNPDNPGEQRELVVILLKDIKYDNKTVRVRGDAIKPGDTVSGRTASRADVCFNLVDEDPKQIVDTPNVFGTMGELKKKTLWQQGAYTTYKKIEGSIDNNNGAGPPNNNQELEKMTEYARKLRATVNLLLPLADQLRTAVNEDVPDTIA